MSQEALQILANASVRDLRRSLTTEVGEMCFADEMLEVVRRAGQKRRRERLSVGSPQVQSFVTPVIQQIVDLTRLGPILGEDTPYTRSQLDRAFETSGYPMLPTAQASVNEKGEVNATIYLPEQKEPFVSFDQYVYGLLGKRRKTFVRGHQTMPDGATVTTRAVVSSRPRFFIGGEQKVTKIRAI